MKPDYKGLAFVVELDCFRVPPRSMGNRKYLLHWQGQVACCRWVACPETKEGKMPSEFNPLQDLASILGSFAKVLPPLPPPPPPPFPLTTPPPVESPSGLAEPSGLVDTRDPLVEAGMENYRAEQAARGIKVLHFE